MHNVFHGRMFNGVSVVRSRQVECISGLRPRDMFRLKTFGHVYIVIGVEAWEVAVMDSSTSSPSEKVGGSRDSVTVIEGGAEPDAGVDDDQD